MSVFTLPSQRLAEEIAALDALGEKDAARLLRSLQPLADIQIRRETRRDRPFSIEEARR